MFGIRTEIKDFNGSKMANRKCINHLPLGLKGISESGSEKKKSHNTRAI
jgi:hypothetical protein